MFASHVLLCSPSLQQYSVFPIQSHCCHFPASHCNTLPSFCDLVCTAPASHTFRGFFVLATASTSTGRGQTCYIRYALELPSTALLKCEVAGVAHDSLFKLHVSICVAAQCFFLVYRSASTEPQGKVQGHSGGVPGPRGDPQLPFTSGGAHSDSRLPPTSHCQPRSLQDLAKQVQQLYFPHSHCTCKSS